MVKDKFSRDLRRLLARLTPKTNPDVMRELVRLRKVLESLRKKQLVKINHSVIELLCARHLITEGYHVSVEKPLEESNLIADLYAVLPHPTHSALTKDALRREVEESPTRTRFGSALPQTLVVEVETGFVPPEAALSPGNYRQMRIAAKIGRYSGQAEGFALATPNYHVLQIPQVLLRPAQQRDLEEVKQLKKRCDDYYSSPPILLDALATVELNAIYIINVDLARVVKIAPNRYLDTILRANGLLQV